MKLKVLDLFSGIGGFSLGLERTGGFETVAFCEIDPFCQKVLKKHWPDVPIFNDVRTLDYDGPVDVITGGYPCQPFSVAGQRKGQKDDRHLWPAMFELVKKYRPAWVIGENVAGHFTLGLDEVLSDLASEGYRTRVFNIPACALNARHRRERLWIISNTGHGAWENGVDGVRTNGYQKNESPVGDAQVKDGQRPLTGRENIDRCGMVANTASKRLQGSRKIDGQVHTETEADREADIAFAVQNGEWDAEPELGRVVNGLPDELAGGHGYSRIGAALSLIALGNTLVPQIPEIIGHAILQAEAMT